MALKIGLRNLSRRKWRSWLTGTMLGFGSFFLVFMVGMAEGTYDKMIDLATKSLYGDFQVLDKRYHHTPGINKKFKIPSKLDQVLSNSKQLNGTAPRVESFGLLSMGNKTYGTMVIGVDLEREKRVTSFWKKISKGDWWSPTTNSIPVVIGKHLAKKIKAGLNDELAYVSSAADGSIVAELLTVVGVLDTGILEIDQNVIFVPIRKLQEVLVMGSNIHRLIGTVKSRKVVGQQGEVRQIINKEIENHEKLIMMAWDELLPELAETIKVDREYLYVFLVFLLIVVLVGVSNSTLMSVLERTKEMGVLQALGTTPGMVVLINMAEVFWLSFFSISIGTILGFSLNIFFQGEGIPLGDMAMDYGGVIIDTMPTLNTMRGSLIFPLIVLFFSLLAGLFPSIRGGTMNIIEALRR